MSLSLAELQTLATESAALLNTTSEKLSDHEHRSCWSVTPR